MSTMSRLASLLAAALLLAACAGPAPKTPDMQTARQQAALLLEQGRRAEAADRLWALAQLTPPPQREALQLEAVEAVLTPETAEQARAYLAQIDERRLDPEGLARSRLAQARLYLFEERPRKALEALPVELPEFPAALQLRIGLTEAEARAAAGQILESVRKRLALEPLITDSETLQANREALWKSLSPASGYDLFNWAGRARDPVLKGWLELAYIAKTTAPELTALEVQLARWRQAYPEHPARPLFLERLRAQWKEYETYPGQIAVLLPLTGKYSVAAEAVLDGLLAVYYQDTAADRPALRLYDVGERPGDVWSIYSQAVQEGAQFVLGPLDKQAVNVLARMERLPVPVLSLNYADSSVTPPPDLYQFGLLPEDEARQVAERLTLAGHRYAIAFAPQGEWGERILTSFRRRFEALGGTVLTSEQYAASATDHSASIRRALNLNRSEARYRRLRTTVKQEVKFEPRRRRDVDVIFIAGTPRQARSLKPQLDFHHAADLPVYATSHVYTGAPDPRYDRDLDGLIFCDIPWVLPGVNPDQTLREQTERLLPQVSRRYPRLVALGADAYRIIPYLKRLRAQPYERYQGLTGNLHMDEAGRLHRDLNWARFERGRPVLVSGEELGGPPQPQTP